MTEVDPSTPLPQELSTKYLLKLSTLSTLSFPSYHARSSHGGLSSESRMGHLVTCLSFCRTPRHRSEVESNFTRDGQRKALDSWNGTLSQAPTPNNLASLPTFPRMTPFEITLPVFAQEEESVLGFLLDAPSGMLRYYRQQQQKPSWNQSMIKDITGSSDPTQNLASFSLYKFGSGGTPLEMEIQTPTDMDPEGRGGGEARPCRRTQFACTMSDSEGVGVRRCPIEKLRCYRRPISDSDEGSTSQICLRSSRRYERSHPSRCASQDPEKSHLPRGAPSVASVVQEGGDSAATDAGVGLSPTPTWRKAPSAQAPRQRDLARPLRRRPPIPVAKMQAKGPHPRQRLPARPGRTPPPASLRSRPLGGPPTTPIASSKPKGGARVATNPRSPTYGLFFSSSSSYHSLMNFVLQLQERPTPARQRCFQPVGIISLTACSTSSNVQK
ncbi:unnamed protein product [Phytomonas sp. EM1]|nr:unnamed protein product [Phytomonas sp. EM1]|eukprot:CCW64833.1 unnamed protein product [Phytomonas sp. isolate EM1]